MALHARCVAVTAGPCGGSVQKVVNLLVMSGQVKLDKAKEILLAFAAEKKAATHER